MSIFRRIWQWFKYDRLHYYPALDAFDPDEALKRLAQYEREERAACRSWTTTLTIIITIHAVLWVMLAFVSPLANAMMVVWQSPFWIMQYVLYRRIRRRVEAKVAAELGGGRLRICVECGYDLRASPERCPECGASARVDPPVETGKPSTQN